MKKAKRDEQQDAEFTLEVVEDVRNDLDPKLQEVILARRAGRRIDPAVAGEAEDGELVVDVLAKLKDPAQPVAGLLIATRIGQIVTGSVKVSDIEAVRANNNVLSLKRASKLHETLGFSVHEIGATAPQLQAALPNGTSQVTGQGVIVGVVDYGCDFAHPNFRHADGTTRLLYLWDQSSGQTSLSPAGYNYGREFNASAINGALRAANPYQALAYQPAVAAHGTHVMDIAAGNGRATNKPGVAPQADLIFVEVATSDFEEDDSFGNSRRLLEAVKYIFDKAQELGKSAVINLSLGTHGGPHDGSTLVEQGFDELLQTPGRAVVIAAGNSWARASHASGRIQSEESRTLTWEILPGDPTRNELEVWYGGAHELELMLTAPNGVAYGPFRLGTTTRIRHQESEAGVVYHRRQDSANGDHQIDVLFTRNMPSGNWQVTLRAVSAEPVEFHAWIERDDDGQSRFAAQDDDRACTLGSISCGEHTIVVGAYNAAVPARDLYGFTAQGPTRSGRRKPEVSAPGVSLAAARALIGGATKKSGTSMAAPHVSGLVALLMQAAGRALTIEQVRAAVSDTARKQPPAGQEWDARYGLGRVDAVAAVLTQVQAAPLALTAATAVEAAAGNGHQTLPVGDWLTSLIKSAGGARVRVQLEIEIEPR